MALLIPFPQIKIADSLQEPLHQVPVRNKPSLNKNPALPTRQRRANPPSELLSTGGSCCCSDSAFGHVGICHGFAHRVTLKHLLSWSCCWNRGGQSSSLHRAPQQGLFHQHLGIKQWKSGSPILAHRSLTRAAPPGLHPRSRSFTPRWGRASASQEFLSTDISTSDARKTPALSTPSPTCSPCLSY